MKFLNSIILGALCIAGSSYADGFGINLGPFDLQFGIGPGYNYYPDNSFGDTHRFVLHNPICDAISNQQQLGFIVEAKEIVNAKEVRVVTKRVVIEPYVFGVTKEGKPILRGNVISEKLVREVNVKFGEDQYGEDQIKESKSNDGRSTKWFQSADKKDIDIQHIDDVNVIEGTHFDAPKNYEGIKDENIRVICQLPVTK
jgi:hypothetical protein